MKSTDWLILPIYRLVYPEKIYEIAKRCGSEPEEIAEAEKVVPGRKILKAIPFDMLDLIIDVEQADDDKNATYVTFADEDETIIKVLWPIKKFIKTIDLFMTGSPTYRKIDESQQMVTFHAVTYPPLNQDESDEEDSI